MSGPLFVVALVGAAGVVMLAGGWVGAWLLLRGTDRHQPDMSRLTDDAPPKVEQSWDEFVESHREVDHQPPRRRFVTPRGGAR
ncbi:MAG TPA: hypothetical protein VFW64_12420 [Pseudonocardiaceae bacterium]|nr:hypothetical protein [Pseudonocardiaceae bacterium]